MTILYWKVVMASSLPSASTFSTTEQISIQKLGGIEVFKNMS